jgi:hypothetical protein
MELPIQGGSAVAICVEPLCRLRFLIGGFSQLTLEVRDALPRDGYPFAKLVKGFINVTQVRVLIDQGELRLAW